LTDRAGPLDTQRVCELDPEEVRLIAAMRASASCAALGAAPFIVGEIRTGCAVRSVRRSPTVEDTAEGTGHAMILDRPEAPVWGRVTVAGCFKRS